ncbi:MAG: DUF1207 domain-containing protein [Pirellulaceae bacterium]|nr:DUF1207 domain-containing protein [Pirellulaceae bacterium]
MVGDRTILARWLMPAAWVLLLAAVATAQEAAAPDADRTVSDARPPALVTQPYFDLDAYLDEGDVLFVPSSTWEWQLLPGSLIYKSYLAGIKEPRAGTTITYLREDGRLWEGILGARLGMLRFGDRDPLFPQGFQLDVEGAAFARLDVDTEVDVRATDYRVGVPFTYGWGRQQLKFAYYHLSSHLGDEFVLKNPGYPRLNWSRDALVLGYSYFMTETLRLYAEAGWAMHSEINEPWEFQFGVDWAPTSPTGFRGAPFLAVNGHIRQEVDFGGNLTAMTGWSWLSEEDRHLLRLGVQYYNGKSSQYSFYNRFEDAIALGLWYDF